LAGKIKPNNLKVGIVPVDISINFKKAINLGYKIPFDLFESSDNIIGISGKAVWKNGKRIKGLK